MQALSGYLYDLLVWLYQYIPNLGLEIILVTLIFKALILALTFKSLKQNKQMQAMNVELQDLKRKYGHDKEVFNAKQVELAKKYNINPLSGCIPQLIQIFVLILFYQALIRFVGTDQINGVAMSTQFIVWNLAEVDPYYVLPVLAAGTQMLLSYMISPGAQTRDLVPNKSRKKAVKEANKAEEDQAQMAQTMQKQMMFMMPVMTGIICLRMPAGVVLYWIVSTLFSIGQQFLISGPGRLAGLAFWKKVEVVE